jgi:signal transduction histidine kinase
MEAEALPAGTDSLAHFGGRLQIQPCLIDTLIKPVVELTRSLAEATEMTFQVEPPDTETWVQADGKALIEILNNFIDNALKYSPPGDSALAAMGLIATSPFRPHRHSHRRHGSGHSPRRSNSYL